MKKIILSVLALIVALMSTAVAVFGWLAAGTSVPLDSNFSGAILSNYFASGDGSEGDAFIINRPNHLYNLAWLQNNGFFDSKQYYFEITADLDMSGYVLPPIGTKDNPFIGNLDGNNCTINKLTVSNVKKDNSKPNEVSPVPTSVNDNAIGNEYTDIVGFFGVIGHYPHSSDDAVCPNNVSVSNLYLDNLTVRTRTSNTLIGLFAGYVCGNVSNIGVYRSMVSIGSGVSTLGAINEDISFNNHSNYALIGAYDEKTTGWADTETSSGGAGASFGGSIDLMNLIRRVNYMVTDIVGTTLSSAYKTASYDKAASYNLYFSKGYKPWELYWKSTDASYGDLLAGTYIPLNVDLKTIFSGDETPIDQSSANSFSTNSYYTTYHSEANAILSRNTGYIVGGQITSSSTSGIRLRVQPLSDSSNMTIYKSLRADSGSGLTYNNNNLDLVTNLDGTFYRIEDDYNKNSTAKVQVTEDTKSSSDFERYSAVRDKLESMLDNNNGSSRADQLYGLRFMNTVKVSSNYISGFTNLGYDSIAADSSNSSYYVLKNGENVYLNGKNYSSYQFLNYSINFTLKDTGYMSAVFGGYAAASSTTQYSFTLYKVERAESVSGDNLTNTIESIEEITSVWLNDNAGNNIKDSDILYNQTANNNGKYTYNDITYTKVYDKSWYNGNIAAGTAYYAEIPLTAGDYCLGGVSSSYSAYLMYLDIGANGAEGGSSGGETDTDYEIDNVRFVYKESESAIEYKTLENLYMFQIVFDKEKGTSGTHVYFLMTSSAMCYYIDVTIDTSGATSVSLTNESLSATNSVDLSDGYGGTKEPPSETNS